MSNLARYAAGSLAPAWAACFGSELNSLASGSVAVSSMVLDNSTALDLWANLSFSVTGTTPGSGSPNLALYVLPQNQDGTTYGDGTASGTTVPSATLFERAFLLPLGKSSVALLGQFRRVALPEGPFVFALVNNTGNALALSGNTVKYRTFVENLNG